MQRHIPMTRAEPHKNVQALLQGDYILTASRAAQETAGKIRCHPSGLYVNPLAMRSRDIRIADIAHHLSLICRYTGACPNHYSVGQHSIIVSDWLAQRGANTELQLAGLLHDAAEYVLNDLASPVKHDLRMKWYRDLDRELSRMIFCVFGVNPDLLQATKEADDAIFRLEAKSWWGGERHVHAARQPATVEALFLDRFNYLHGSLHQ